jgi:hypothetical protein
MLGIIAFRPLKFPLVIHIFGVYRDIADHTRRELLLNLIQVSESRRIHSCVAIRTDKGLMSVESLCKAVGSAEHV